MCKYLEPCTLVLGIQAFSNFHKVGIRTLSSLGIHKTRALAKDPSLVLPPVESESLPL